METINIKNLPISSNNNLKTVIGFNENDELIKATYSNNGGGVVDLTDYYTKEEVYTKEQVDSIADNYYNDYMDDYRYLNGRIDNLENNGGGDVEPLVIELQANTINDVLFGNVKITNEQFFQLYNNLINFIKVTAPDGDATLHIIGSQRNTLYFIDGYNEYLFEITYYDFLDLQTLKKKTRFAPYDWVKEINNRLTTLENKVQELENKTN